MTYIHHYFSKVRMVFIRLFLATFNLGCFFPFIINPHSAVSSLLGFYNAKTFRRIAIAKTHSSKGHIEITSLKWVVGKRP